MLRHLSRAPFTVNSRVTPRPVVSLHHAFFSMKSEPILFTEEAMAKALQIDLKYIRSLERNAIGYTLYLKPSFPHDAHIRHTISPKLKEADVVHAFFRSNDRTGVLTFYEAGLEDLKIFLQEERDSSDELSMGIK